MINLGQVRRLAKHVNADHARKFTEHMVPHVVRPAQIIWNKVIGLIFLIFAIEAFTIAYRAYQALGASSNNNLRLLFSLFFGVVMLGFGIASFLRARRLSRK